MNSSGVSFGFTKTISKKALESSAINETDEKGSDAAQAEPTQTWNAKPKTEEEKLVIPLKSGNWQLERRRDDVRKASDSKNRRTEVGDAATDAAVQEILAESKQIQKDENLSIAMTLQHADGTERGSGLLRRTIRNDNDREIEDEDYEKIPIAQFGKAMLRGMGWKDEQDSSSSKAYEARPRPQGLGLGANVPLHSAAYAVKSKTGNADEEKLMLKTGVHCQVLTGKLEGQYGTVTGVEEDAVRVYVTMSLSGENVTLSQYAIKLVTKTEYDKEHRYINKKSVEKYKSENGGDFRTERVAEVGGTRDDSDRDQDRRKRDDNGEERTSLKRKSERDDEKATQKKKKQDQSSSSIWVHPCLKVRFVDEKFKNGRYFKTKVVIIDVVSRDSCICRAENGDLLEGIRQDQLETVIPRDLTSTMMIVKGSHRSQLAEILDRDKERCKAVIQFIPDRDQVLTLDYDSICEYVGPVH